MSLDVHPAFSFFGGGLNATTHQQTPPPMWGCKPGASHQNRNKYLSSSFLGVFTPSFKFFSSAKACFEAK
jgi:hypothetical protein